MYRITKQRNWFRSDETITDENRIEEILCDSFNKVVEEIEITDNNLEIALTINSNYKVGDIHILPLRYISYIKNGIEQEIDVLGDPYYKLDQFINNEWILIEKHNCSNDRH